MDDLQALAKSIRREILEMIYRTKSPHIGCSFSIVDILVALYFRVLRVDPKNSRDPDRDRFLLSKGHGAPALYPTLARRGFISQEILDGFAKDGGTLEQHPCQNLDCGVEFTSGSLGHGLSVACGMALAAKQAGKNYRLFVLSSDGDLEEGSSWEAILFANQHKLDNLVAIVDYNKLSALGKISEIMNLDPLREKFESFGWQVKEVGGHNLKEIIGALERIPFQPGKPNCLICKTVKGKGVSFMEDDPQWHDKYPSEEEYQKAVAELQ